MTNTPSTFSFTQPAPRRRLNHGEFKAGRHNSSTTCTKHAILYTSSLKREACMTVGAIAFVQVHSCEHAQHTANRATRVADSHAPPRRRTDEVKGVNTRRAISLLRGDPHTPPNPTLYISIVATSTNLSTTTTQASIQNIQKGLRKQTSDYYAAPTSNP